MRRKSENATKAPVGAAIPWKRSIPPVQAPQRLAPTFSPIPVVGIYQPAIGYSVPVPLLSFFRLATEDEDRARASGRSTPPGQPLDDQPPRAAPAARPHAPPAAPAPPRANRRPRRPPPPPPAPTRRAPPPRRRRVLSGRGGKGEQRRRDDSNQRDRDRERVAARKPNAKGPQDGLTPEQRRERDKKALEEKAAKKAQQAAAGATGTSTDNKNKGGGKK
ncbi:branchpoint-bridging protein-like isoform X2 [Panicum hallii]|uniref:branchpoint-bridging protein-like isoform X2 n=1 Tax=Panicum hallii TaxID=206008 RepID=UPI000DF4D229|nr:branchpoint-bridging protein-like isoform X2 [Panicum hallii]